MCLARYLDVLKAEIRTSIAPDHKSVFLSVEIKSEFKRGPGLWKVNNTLLEDENYKELIMFYYSQIVEKHSEVTDKQLLWELIKMELRSKTIKYSKQKRREIKDIEITLQTRLQDLDKKICNSNILDKEILDSYEAAKEELKRIHELRGHEATFRSKMKWIEQGEKPTKYFFNLEKSLYEKKLIRELKLENDEITSNPTLINKEIESFYANTYTSKFDETRISQQNIPFEDFIEGLNIPQLSKEEQEHLAQDLTCKELKDALSSFTDNKTPGEDGFTKEFYEAFFDLLWKDLLQFIQRSF